MTASGADHTADSSRRCDPSVQTLPVLSDYATYVMHSNPVWATRSGMRAWDGQLGLVDPGSQADYSAELALFLHDFQRLEVTGLSDRLDLQASRIDAGRRLREMERVRPWVRVPYLYVEQIGTALRSAVALSVTHPDQGPEVLLATLADIPRYLITARRNLDAAQVPAEYLQMARTAGAGVRRLLEASSRFVDVQGTPVLAQLCQRSRRRALQSLADFSEHLSAMQSRAGGSWRMGAGYYQACLGEDLLTDMGVAELAHWARERVADDRRALTEHARSMDRSRTWQEQLARIRRAHPAPQDLFEAYAAALQQARDHTLRHDLATVPEGESCAVDLLPDFVAAGCPTGALELAAPWDQTLSSRVMVAAVRRLPDGSPDREQLADSCYTAITSLSGQVSYPGLHVQRVHHKLATVGNASIRRAFTSTAFTLGWGRYAADLMAETGYLDSADLQLHRMRDSLWHSSRMVVDLGLHTGDLGIAEAVDYLVSQTGAGQRLAQGEVHRLIRHDSGAQASASVLGCQELHQLRQRWARRRPAPGALRAFHDAVLGYGSIPLRLIEQEVLRRARPPERGA